MTGIMDYLEWRDDIPFDVAPLNEADCLVLARLSYIPFEDVVSFETSIRLDDAVRASVRRFAGEFIDRGLKLDFRPGGAQVLTDAKWLGFMLDQLISNALKYTPSGGVTIEMEGETTLAIRDSGIGISPQDLPRIFERGYTGRNGRADQRASGIGLYLCRRIADNLGHALYAESEPGRGTVMRIDFPKREARHE